MYLFLQSLPPTVLGALMSLTSTVLYPTYELAPRITIWTAIQDQTVAGLVMWLPGALGYFVVLSGIFYVWVEKRAASDGEAPFRNVNPGRARRDGRVPTASVASEPRGA
jgi:putative membrane protein